jgi:hypothetical protein
VQTQHKPCATTHPRSYPVTSEHHHHRLALARPPPPPAPANTPPSLTPLYTSHTAAASTAPTTRSRRRRPRLRLHLRNLLLQAPELAVLRRLLKPLPCLAQQARQVHAGCRQVTCRAAPAAVQCHVGVDQRQRGSRQLPELFWVRLEGGGALQTARLRWQQGQQDEVRGGGVEEGDGLA